MATSIRRLTYDDLESIPQEREGDRHELIDGELFVTPSPITAHQIISGNIVYSLEKLVRERGLGQVFTAPIDVRLTPGNVLVPDICFISADRLHIVGRKTVDAAKDLVIEILSPGTRRRDLDLKRNLYARFGVQEYWVVDPKAQSVTVWALARDHYEPVPIGNNNTIQSVILPDLVLTFEEVFANASMT